MASYETYVVKPGNSLGKIAKAHNTTVGELVALNGIADPDKIGAGQVLNVRRSSATTYVVRRGDTLSAIAGHYGVTVAALAQANGIANPNLLAEGRELAIPESKATDTAARPPVPEPSGTAAAGQVPCPGAAAIKAAQIARQSVLPKSAGKCYRYVKKALLAAGAVDHYLGGGSAIEAGPLLIQQGFTDILGLPSAGIKSPYDAPTGAVLVYKATPYATDKNRIHGHIEIRTADGFASDYYSPRARTGPRENGLAVNSASGRALAGVYVKPDKQAASAPIPPVSASASPPVSPQAGAADAPFASDNLKLEPVNGKYLAAITEASERTAMAPQTVAAIIEAEAAKVPGTRQWDANSKAGTSSASGLTQFLDGTWRGEARRAGGLLNAEAKKAGCVDGSNAIADDRRLLAMRFDPRIAIIAGADYAVANLAIMRNTGVLPVALDPAGTAKLAYLAHHEGPNRAVKFLRGQMGYVTQAIFSANVPGSQRQSLLTAAHGDTGVAYRNWMAGYVDSKIDVTRYMLSSDGVVVPKLSSFFL